MTTDSERRTAIHEAGHAVIGRVFGMTCGHATIEADNDSSGHGFVADPWQILTDWERREHYRDATSVFHGRIMTYMAGALAEIELLGDSGGGDDDDQFQLALMMESARVPKVTGNWDIDRDRQIDRWRHRAAMRVKKHRALIERVANALMSHRTLSGLELDALVAENGGGAGVRLRKA